MREAPREATGSMNAQRALVTGATGFIGSHLVRALVNEGWVVDVVVRRSSDQVALADVRTRLSTHLHDGSAERLLEILADARPDVVFHLASYFKSEHDSTDLEQIVSTNVLFAAQLAEAMVRTGATRLVNSGTIWQHFGDRDYSPMNLYAASKQAAEALLRYYAERRAMKVITLELSDTYGPGDRRRKLIPLLKDAVRRGDRLELSPGHQLINLTHVDDVVMAFKIGAMHLLDGHAQAMERYSASSSNWLTIRELVGLLGRVIGKDIDVAWGARPYTGQEIMTVMKGSPPLPGWSASVSLANGLQSLFAGE